MLNKIGQLIIMKKIIALILTIVFCILSLKGTISSMEFLSVFTLVVGFYFGNSVAKENKRF